MQYVVLDLEWNSGFCKRTRSFINEIIELGAVKLDEEMNIIGQFSIFVRPDITKRLNATVKELTQITNEDLKHGATFTYAISKFRKFVADCTVMSWSTTDLSTLEANCEYYYGSQRIPFLKYYADVQDYFQSVCRPEVRQQMALQAAAEALSVPMDDIPLHRAVGDSILTARILKKIYSKERFEPFIRPVDDEFYRRLNFHITYLCNYDNPLIDKSQMYFICPSCKETCQQTEAWKVKNRAFNAVFECLSCAVRYKGRIQFKLQFDGVKIIKKLSPVSDECPAAGDEQSAASD